MDVNNTTWVALCIYIQCKTLGNQYKKRTIKSQGQAMLDNALTQLAKENAELVKELRKVVAQHKKREPKYDAVLHYALCQIGDCMRQNPRREVAALSVDRVLLMMGKKYIPGLPLGDYERVIEIYSYVLECLEGEYGDNIRSNAA